MVYLGVLVKVNFEIFFVCVFSKVVSVGLFFNRREKKGEKERESDKRKKNKNM